MKSIEQYNREQKRFESGKMDKKEMQKLLRNRGFDPWDTLANEEKYKAIRRCNTIKRKLEQSKNINTRYYLGEKTLKALTNEYKELNKKYNLINGKAQEIKNEKGKPYREPTREEIEEQYKTEIERHLNNKKQ